MKKFLLIILLLVPNLVYAKTEAIIDLNKMNIYEIQDSVDKGYINYETIMKIYLERIEEYNEKYNAIITLNENALEEAKKMDLEYQKNGRKSYLHGLPILVKDNIDVKGMPTTAGTKALKNNYPKENAPIIQKLIDAGAIIIGKTNMSEFAFNATDSFSSYGHVHNAFDLDYSSYGSSGGTAVGVSANLAVAGIGTDTGSSIRIPSAANGLVGLRPTVDSINMDGIIKFEATRDVAGPITKFVEDSAIILEIIDESDNDYQSILKSNSLEGIKIAVIKGFMNPNTNSTAIATGLTDREIYNLMTKAIEDLKNLGAEIIYLDNFALPYKFDATTMCYDFNTYIKGTEGPIKSYSDLLNSGLYVNGLDGYNTYCNSDYRETSSYKSYLSFIKSNINRANNIFESNKIDAIIYPTLKTSLLKLSEIHSRKLYTPSSSIAPLVGFPSMNVQIGFYNDLPYGMEILSQRNKEDVIYKIAYNYQNVNNYYKTPSIAPSLYEIPDNITTLLSYLNENKSDNEYKLVYDKIKNFINDYNNISDKKTEINNLIQEYNNVPNVIKRKKEEKRKRILIISSSSAASFVLILLFILKGRRK